MAKEPENKYEIVLYQTEDGRTRLEVKLENEKVWLTQGQMAELFQTTKQNVSLYFQNVFTEKELREDSVVKESLTTAGDGKNYQAIAFGKMIDGGSEVGFPVVSIPAKPLAQAKLKCGGFFIARTENATASEINPQNK